MQEIKKDDVLASIFGGVMTYFSQFDIFMECLFDGISFSFIGGGLGYIGGSTINPMGAITGGVLGGAAGFKHGFKTSQFYGEEPGYFDVEFNYLVQP